MIIFSVGESATSNTKYLQHNNDRKKWLLIQNHIIVSKRLDLEEFLCKPPKLTFIGNLPLLHLIIISVEKG